MAVHADTASRNLRHLRGRGESGIEDKLLDLPLCQLGTLIHQTTLDGFLQHRVGINALAVITDAYQLLPAGNDIDLHGLRTGVEAVFDQFLDHRGGPLDDLAGSDLIDQLGRQFSDRHDDDRRIPEKWLIRRVAARFGCQDPLVFGIRIT